LLGTIDKHEFPRVRIVFGLNDETGARGIVAQILPFLTIAFVIAQNVIEKTALPDRMSIRSMLDRFSQLLFQGANPST
jgi:hypothetical protein